MRVIASLANTIFDSLIDFFISDFKESKHEIKTKRHKKVEFGYW